MEGEVQFETGHGQI